MIAGAAVNFKLEGELGKKALSLTFFFNNFW